MGKKTAVFFGTPEFALPSLEATVAECEVLGVVTQPDRPRGRGQKLSPCPVKNLALQKGLRCFSPTSLKKPSPERDELRQFAEGAKPDLLIVAAYGNILTPEWLALPKLGPLNVHGSLLPRWRGAAPIQRCLELGDTKTRHHPAKNGL